MSKNKLKTPTTIEEPMVVKTITANCSYEFRHELVRVIGNEMHFATVAYRRL